VLLFGYIIYDIFLNQPHSTNNPWYVPSFYTPLKGYANEAQGQANTIEWTLPSPIPFHAFKMLAIQS
jgi:hypothetical protein